VKARLPTFSHNLHLDIHSILLIFSDIHQKPTCRLFDSIQFLCCIIPRNAPHFFVSSTAIPVNRCLTECDFIRENPPSSGQVVDFEQLIRKTPLVYGQTWHFESTFYSNRFMVASRTASHRKKLNSHADSTKLVKPSRRIASLSQYPLIPFSSGHIRPSCAPERMATASLFFGRHLMMPCYTTYLVPRRSRIRLKSTNSRSSALERRFFS